MALCWQFLVQFSRQIILGRFLLISLISVLNAPAALWRVNPHWVTPIVVRFSVNAHLVGYR